MLKKAQGKYQKENGCAELIFIFMGKNWFRNEPEYVNEELKSIIHYWFWTFEKL